MKEVEQTGKTVEEATRRALEVLGVSAAEAEVEVIEEPGKGLLSLLSLKQAKVRASVRGAARGGEDGLRDFLAGVAERLGITCRIEIIKRGEYLWALIEGEGLGFLIGKHGQTLNALQYLANMAANRETDERQRIIVDINSYREHREEVLTHLAQRLARQVREAGRSVHLEAMTPHERRIIHLALRDEMDIVTYSHGQEPFRYVIIARREGLRSSP